VGRMGRFLKLFGMRVGLDECEQIIQTECGIECACVGTDEKMLVYITNADKQNEVKETLVQKTHIVATSFHIRIINEIPKNEAGKKLYSKLSIN
jgi:acyl-coenzyme A synthetase/AMP-(fatty) acid ligase